MIPVNEPFIGEREKQYVSECLETGWISSAGRFIPEFENRFAQYCGRQYGVSVNNGSNALIAAFRALELPPGSEVIMPSFTIISCALACVYNGLVPVFADACPDTWNMDLDWVKRKLSPRTRAIMAVHIYGHPSDMDSLMELASGYGLRVVEDFAEAIGSRYKDKLCGCFGDISCASFYANKAITTGEGGMCLTDDKILASRLESIRNLCFLPQPRFVHEEPGFNFRMTNIQAAIGLAQLERIEETVQKKRRIGETYARLLAESEKKGLLRLPVQKEWAFSTWWMFGLVLNPELKISAREVQEKLEKRGVQTRPFFHPMHKQPVFARMRWFKDESMPVAEHLGQNGFYLPSGVTLTEENMIEAASALTEILNGF